MTSFRMTRPPRDLSAALADRYRIERELGTGGMATVWLARDLRHDRRVAVKVLKPELTAVLGGDRFIHRSRPPRRSRGIRVPLVSPFIGGKYDMAPA